MKSKSALPGGWIPFEEFLIAVHETRENIRKLMKKRILYPDYGVKKLPGGRKYTWGNVQHYIEATNLNK